MTILDNLTSDQKFHIKKIVNALIAKRNAIQNAGKDTELAIAMNNIIIPDYNKEYEITNF